MLGEQKPETIDEILARLARMTQEAQSLGIQVSFSNMDHNVVAISSEAIQKEDLKRKRDELTPLQLVNNDTHSDVTLIIGEKSYFGHREHLSRSPYFKRLFKTNSEPTIVLDLPVHLKEKDMLIILDYAYAKSVKRVQDEKEYGRTAQSSLFTGGPKWKSDLLLVAMAADILELDDLVQEIAKVLVMFRPWHFSTYEGLKPGSTVSHRIVKAMCRAKTWMRGQHDDLCQAYFMLWWFSLCIFEFRIKSGKESAWNLAEPTVRAHADELIRTYIVPQFKDLSRVQIRKILGNTKVGEVLDLVPMTALAHCF